MIELFDTHFHYYGKEEPQSLAKRAKEAGVIYLLAATGNHDEAVIASELCGKIDNCWFAAGVHPHEASSFNGDIKSFEKFLSHPRFAAVGEVGLDFFYENSDRDSQLKVFSSFIEFAESRKLPLIVHCRDKNNSEEAYSKAYELLSGFSKRGGGFVLHCYTGSVAWAERFLSIGAYISTGGIVTFPKGENVREMVRIIPDDKLLLETDSPYLSPHPFRGRENHPEYLRIVAEFVAKMKGITLEELAATTTRNAFDFFKVKHHEKN